MSLLFCCRKRQLKMCVSFAVTVGMLAVAFAVMICSLNLQGYVRRKNAAYLHINTFAQLSHPGRLFDPNGWLFFVPGITHAISIMILNNVYRMVGRAASPICQGWFACFLTLTSQSVS